uniref:Uncharacterized protein n=1 Tax=Fagus sylvatica TaxID=28930 RepID=A0A2N9IC21_FAGSY
MALSHSDLLLSLTQSRSLQRRAPDSLQISTPSPAWNVAIPLLSPLAASPHPAGYPKLGVDEPRQLQQPQIVTEPEKVAVKKWQHPAAPFCYGQAPRVKNQNGFIVFLLKPISKRSSSRPRCSSTTPDNKTKTPQILKLTVTGVTELLRLFSSNQTRLERESDKEREEIAVSGIDDVVMILKSDYENAYFVTGVFTCAIYAQDCIFEDPTIRFRGKELYSRNLKLLVPFFDNPSIGLQKIKKVVILYVKFDFNSNNGMVGYLHIN